MPIKSNEELLSQFSKTDLSKIKTYRKVCTVLSLTGLILNFIVYLLVTFFGFLYWGPEGYYYDYYVRLELINISYFVTWFSIYLASFCILLHIFLLRFTINPHISILKNRKVKKIENIEGISNRYYASIRFRVITFLVLIGIMIIELNYYPRNTELFYPFIACNSESGICVVTSSVFILYVSAMTIFIVLTTSFYSAMIIVDKKEINTIKKIINPRFKEEVEKKIQEKTLRNQMTIDEKRKKKIEQIRQLHEQARKKKEEDYRKKFEKMLKKEQYGKRGFKKDVKGEKQIGKQKEKVQKSKRKDDYDFT